MFSIGRELASNTRLVPADARHGPCRLLGRSPRPSGVDAPEEDADEACHMLVLGGVREIGELDRGIVLEKGR
jgi:hypothetical protein